MSKEILKADFVFGYTIRAVNLLYWNKHIAAMKKGKKMERYKVILVDDEAEVIDMIEKKFIGMIWGLKWQEVRQMG